MSDRTSPWLFRRTVRPHNQIWPWRPTLDLSLDARSHTCCDIDLYQPKNNETDGILMRNWIMQCVIFFSQREQPLFSVKAHVFQIDPATKRNWIPASKHSITVSFFYDAGRSVYRIISVGGTKVRDLVYGRSNLNSRFIYQTICFFCCFM